MPEQGKRTDWEHMREMCKDPLADLLMIADQYPGAAIRHGRGLKELMFLYKGKRSALPELLWLFGSSGVGKSRYVMKHHPDAYWKLGTNKWFDGYSGQETVVIDEFRSSFKFSFFLQLLDRYPLKVETKGGMAQFVPKKIVIVSQDPPSSHYAKMKYKKPLWRRIQGSVYQVLDSRAAVAEAGDLEDAEIGIVLLPWLWPAGVPLLDEEVPFPAGRLKTQWQLDREREAAGVVEVQLPAPPPMFLQRQNAFVAGYHRYSDG